MPMPTLMTEKADVYRVTQTTGANAGVRRDTEGSPLYQELPCNKFQASANEQAMRGAMGITATQVVFFPKYTARHGQVFLNATQRLVINGVTLEIVAPPDVKGTYIKVLAKEIGSA